jgi:hypothetical protein
MKVDLGEVRLAAMAETRCQYRTHVEMGNDLRAAGKQFAS